jgi:hypothetical protein
MCPPVPSVDRRFLGKEKYGTDSCLAESMLAKLKGHCYGDIAPVLLNVATVLMDAVASISVP